MEFLEPDGTTSGAGGGRASITHTGLRWGGNFCKIERGYLLTDERFLIRVQRPWKCFGNPMSHRAEPTAKKLHHEERKDG